MSDLSFVNKKELKIHAQKWLPENEITSCILLLHGYAEYSMRYYKLISELNKAGHAVFALDYQGHGRSEGVRGAAEHYKDLVDDAVDFLSVVQTDYIDRPWLVLGHGLGGNMAIKLASMYPNAFSGMILSAPGLRVDRKIPKVVRDVARNLASVYSNMPVMRLDTRLISRSPEVVNGYKKDPLIYQGCLRAGMAYCLEQAGNDASKALKRIEIPLWVGHGSLDGIHDPADSELVIKRAKSRDKTLKIFDNLYHEILNEPEREEVVSEILNWIEERCFQLESDENYQAYGKRTG